MTEPRIRWILLLVLCLPLRAIAEAAPDAAGTVETVYFTPAAFAPERIRVDVHLPPDYDARAQPGYPVLYVHDGQDMDAVRLRPTLAALYRERTIRPVIVAAIHMLPDRMGTYGLSDRGAGHGLVAETRHGRIGARAHEYAQWVAHELVPAVDARYNTRGSPDARATLGWSLGALAAFNLGWQYPEVFTRVGAFSPSLWLSADRSDAAAVQRTRLAQRMVAGSEPRVGAQFFFAVGTDEETDDRDGDGVNDALDDTRDLIDGWQPAAEGLKGLRQLGYRVNPDHAARVDRSDVALFVLDGGRHEQASWARMLREFLRWAYALRAPAIDATGTVESWQAFPSRFVHARTVDVWLPPGYGEDPARRYPVLYVHDGQNLFDPSLSYTGVDWDIDGAMTRLIEAGQAREAIVVGIWNTPLRFAEYMPRQPLDGATPPQLGTLGGLAPEHARSDAYLRFLVEELKPFVDATYRTRPGRDDTFVMGSSMGGLISLYALARHPQVFGGAAGVSTHWPAGDGVVADWLGAHLPRAGAHRLYFDFGTATLDATYPPYQARMDALLPALGYVPGRDWLTRRFEGAEHNEAAWRARVDVPLRFLLAPEHEAR